MVKCSESEKKSVVEYCVLHNRDYALTANRFGRTYQQVYGWVRKYHTVNISTAPQKNTLSADFAALLDENKHLRQYSLELEIRIALQRKIQQYRRQNYDLADFSGVRNNAEFHAIKDLHEENDWPISKLCIAAGVSKAGYYKWCHRAVSRKQAEDEKIAQLIYEIYQRQHGIPGYRQMKIILFRRYGLKCNLKKVHRIMKLLGLKSVCRRKRQRCKKKTAAEYTAENVLNRDFRSEHQNQKWLTDITELKYGSGGKAYLSAILDLYGRNIVAFSISRSNNTPLVLTTFQQAFEKYPDAKPLVHSDRGTQYTSRAFHREMASAGVNHSMSRVGRCLDNAPMEGFWGIMKTEMYYPCHFEDYNSLCKAICTYIDFYNHDRYQEKLGCMTPAEFIAAADL